MDDADVSDATDTTDAPPRWARAFSYALITLVLLCGVASIEAWPMSAFKLFSGMRGDTRVSYQIRLVDSDGDESELAFRDLPVAYRNTHIVIPRFSRMSEDERDEYCNAWALQPRERGEDVAFLRIYRFKDHVWPDGPDTVVEAIHECGRQ